MGYVLPVTIFLGIKKLKISKLLAKIILWIHFNPKDMFYNH